jgi:hypothetical protein
VDKNLSASFEINPMRMVFRILPGFVLLTVSLSLAQTPGVTVNWEMLDGQGNPITTAYLSFQLWNCSGQVAEVIGYPAAIVQQQFTLTANPSTGIVSGAIFGNNQKSCGNIQSTEWIVQQYKATNQPSGIAQYTV